MATPNRSRRFASPIVPPIADNQDAA